MTRIDIYSGFLGAGKTTLIKKLIKEGYEGKKLVLIENEFGEIGIDGGFLKDAGIEIKEMNSGCICCSLTGDFKAALKKVEETYHPDVIIIEPSGVGKLSEVAAAVIAAGEGTFELGGMTTIVDAKKAKMYIKNFGEFFNDQVSSANCVVLSRTQLCSPELVEDVIALIKVLNENATIITSDWDDLDGKQIMEAIEGKYAISAQLEALIKEHIKEDEEEEHHHHHHHDEGEEHEHHHDEEHEHNHHHDDDDDEECSCGCGHHHHHRHDADEVFKSWGKQTALSYTEKDIREKLEHFESVEHFGMVVRAKGIVQCSEGGWIHFDYTPGEIEIRKGPAAPTGLLCVIGANLNTEMVERLFEG